MEVHKKDATQRGLYTILIKEEEEKGTSGEKWLFRNRGKKGHLDMEDRTVL